MSAPPGAQLWARLFRGVANRGAEAHALAVSPGGNTVYVTGESRGKTTGNDYATIAYRCASGARLWLSRYTAGDFASSVAVSGRGGKVFVTGSGGGGTQPGGYYATVAYHA